MADSELLSPFDITLINIRETFKTSQVATDHITDGLKHILSMFATSLMNEIREHTDGQENIPVQVIEQIFTMLAPHNLMQPMKSKYLLDKLLVENFNMIFPVEQKVGTTKKWKKTAIHPFVDLVDVDEYGYIVPFLKNLLENEQIRWNVDNPIVRQGDRLDTVLHGSAYKRSRVFAENKNALAFILYMDELGIANPLGASSKKEKLCMFYWCLGNIHPWLRSQQDSIQLLAVVKSEYLKEKGIENLLQPFISDIITLQTEGINITVNGMQRIYKGQLLFCTGDTPASAKMGGFKESVTAYRFCRSCFTDNNEWRHNFNENRFIIRDFESHQRHIEAVTEENVEKRVINYWKRRYGVNSRSPLSSIPHFDVTQSLPRDAMHILIEGVSIVAIKAFLSYFIIEMELFTVDDFNARMSCFDFDYFKVNKPAEIMPEHIDGRGKFRQSASQIFSFVHTLPFLVLNIIEDNEDNVLRLICHTRLLQILNVCLSYYIHESTTDILTRMIELYILDFNNLYPNVIVPKFHFFIHIPRYIRMFGPARQQWCFRFEAAHNYFKSLVPVVRNFKNMPYTLSYRHQARLCSRLGSAFDIHKIFLYRGDDISFGETVLIRNLPNAQLLYDNIGEHALPDLLIMRTPKIESYGTVYKLGSVILVQCDEDSLPIFGKIQEMFIISAEMVIIYTTLDTLGYNEETNSYCVQDLPNSIPRVILIRDLIFPHSLPYFTVDDVNCVILLNHERTEFVVSGCEYYL